jgi:hypothetical protein
MSASNYPVKCGRMLHDSGITERQRRSALATHLLATGGPDSVSGSIRALRKDASFCDNVIGFLRVET